MAVVPIFDTTESNTWKYIFQQIEPKCVIVDSNERAKQVMGSVRYKVESLILTSDHLYPDTKLFAERKGINVYAFKEIERMGIIDLQPFVIPKLTDLATLLTHGNLVAAVSGFLLHLDSHFDLKDETMISYLSSAQLRERILKACMFYSGGRIGVYSGDFKDLSRDLPVLMPTVMYCVPRILNRLYNRVISKVRGNWVRSRVLDFALKSKQPEIVK
ncbi:long-chain-fatty-acid--CoA ligase 6-like [Oppia nitens]|uniref:long-chain-fatty-acid--CoA ligase 6-like n=1 Tax=Oppia nitens TaxID=1686743 RepID=UPI0023DC82FA|nr:long-chain-fatty-acid--CoA ligase 6-like [Oppia nitens]